MVKKSLLLLGLCALCALVSPSHAFAYVDPGIIASLYQLVFVVIFGSMFAYVAKPFKAMKLYWYKLTGRELPAPKEDETKAPETAPAEPRE